MYDAYQLWVDAKQLSAIGIAWRCSIAERFAALRRLSEDGNGAWQCSMCLTWVVASHVPQHCLTIGS
jgi:hypothetical protein